MSLFKSSLLFFLLFLIPFFTFSLQENEITAGNYQLNFNQRGIHLFKNTKDPHDANLIPGGKLLGNLAISYKIGNGEWLQPYGACKLVENDSNTIVYSDYESGMPFETRQTFSLNENGLNWKIDIINQMQFPVKIGDLAVNFPWRAPGGGNPNEIFEQNFTKHHYISGDGSFLYFTKPNGEPPYYLFSVNPGTQLEYFKSERGNYLAFIHSAKTKEETKNGTWRQPQTSAQLAPKGENGDTISYSFNLKSAKSYDALRERIYENDLIDVRVVPGMTIPANQPAKFSLHTKTKIDSIIAEFPSETKISFLSEPKKDHFIYEVNFQKLGENKLSIYFDKNRKTYLEFFVTEDLETLVKKRSDFITNKQQHKTEKWYDGLYSIYDMKNKQLRGPDNNDGYTGWWGYVLASDDPALCKAPYVASKNSVYPDKKEIESLEYYIENFVWGGLQRTDKEEPYPYGIYGTPNWYVDRDPVLRAGVKNSNLDKMNIWRSYDYPHIVMLYYNMYLITKMYPEMSTYADADEYLERAYQTAKAYFNYPYEILPWYETYKWGCYNELFILDLIDVLNEENRKKDAEYLESEWQKKVKYFVYDDKYPFRSEYSTDRTAFETSYAVAKYGATHEMPTDENLWFDKKLEKWYSHPKVEKADSRAFMDKQLYANLACRGWLETKYYLLGSDFTASSDTHTLSYMARMGGWGILDYALNFSEDPFDWLQLGYASYLSSYALMNTGTSENNYGYWYPGEENDGALGWAFMSSQYEDTWIKKKTPRGPWYYDGEADLGMGAIKRMAITILAKDPLFDWIAYGGKLKTNVDSFEVFAADGINQKFAIINTEKNFRIELDRDGFSSLEPIKVSKKLDVIDFIIENRSSDTHSTQLKIKTEKEPVITIDSKKIKVRKINEYWIAILPISKSSHKINMKI
ncbi:hypothetical protein SAMN04487907_109158 [Zunongwangia mangrovi]|uniref:Uncharacterized protein n=1 Tax=Zunongwangia mangrovi TaxID=1334022 RepID=A0A1I1MDS4_9FLAO|nr:DUF5695 domain-containing protein [Zunongwangia mangrovi]SFC83544.1 hypothetical protein SAMN04487907_109158 [Zunongwangia mangrovi]